MRKCGFHTQQTNNELRTAIDTVQPTFTVSLHHDRDFWQGVRDSYGDQILLVGRLFELREGFSSDWRQVEPEAWAEECAKQEMPYHAWITRNEPEGIYNEVTPEDAALYDQWCCRFRNRGLELGFEAVGPNVPTGHGHGNWVVKYLPNLCQQFRYISLHEYSARAMWDQQPTLQRPIEDVPQDEEDIIGRWLCLRYRDWYEAICEQYPEREGKFTILMTECGVAYGVMKSPDYGDVGWKTDQTAEQYMASVSWYTREMNQDSYCGGGAFFMVGHADPRWASFETLPLYPQLAQLPEVPPVDDEPEPEEAIMQVFDRDMNELPPDEAEDMLNYYGLSFDMPEGLEEGDPYFAPVAMFEKIDDTACISRVMHADGALWCGIEVVLWWPDMSPDDNDIEIPYAHDWHDEGDIGITEGGDCEAGPSFGGGAAHPPNEPGPHEVWVRHPTIPSVRICGQGWIALTNHDHMNQWWKQLTYTTDGNGGNGGDGGDDEAGPVVATLRDKAQRLRQDADDLDAAADSLEQADELAEELADLL